MMDTEWRRNLGTVGAEARAGKITSLALVASLAVVSGLGAASSASAQSQPRRRLLLNPHKARAVCRR